MYRYKKGFRKSKNEFYIKVYEKKSIIKTWTFSCDAYGELAEKIADLSIKYKRRIYNYFEIKDDHVIMYWTSKNRDNIFEILFDIEDLENIIEKRWFVFKSRQTHYCTESGTGLKMHRFLLNIKDDTVIVDHINRNGLDNRRCNLRIASFQENARNRSTSKNNNSGKNGVHYNSSKNCYVARIINNEGKRIERSFSVKAHKGNAINLAIIARRDLEKLYNYIGE